LPVSAYCASAALRLQGSTCGQVASSSGLIENRSHKAPCAAAADVKFPDVSALGRPMTGWPESEHLP